MRVVRQALAFVQSQTSPRRLHGNAAYMLAGNLIRIGLQACAFLLLARQLGPAGFGAFTAVLAFSSLTGPFLELGAYSLVVQQTTRGVPIKRAVGAALLSSAVVTPLGIVALVVGHWTMLSKVPLTIIMLIGVGTFIGLRIQNIVRGACIACDGSKSYALLDVAGGVGFLASALLLVLMHADIKGWAWLYFGQQVAHATIYGAAGVFLFGWPKATWAEARSLFRPGLHFSVGIAAHNAAADTDKVMLGYLAGLEATGTYSVGFRIMTAAFLPLTALNAAMYKRFFEAGLNGASGAFEVAKRFSRMLTAYGIAAAAALWIAADVIAALFGEAYTGAPEAIRILGLLIPIQGMSYAFADALTGSGFQSWRSFGQVTVLVANIALNIVLIPRYGWQGAAWATLITQTLLLFYLLGALRILCSRTPDARQPVVASK